MRRAAIALPTLLACVLPAACGRPAADHGGTPGAPATVTTAPAAATTGAGRVDLTTVSPCGLVTNAEFAAALGTRTKPPKVARSAESDITCVVESAVDNSAITLDVLRPDEGAQAYLEENRSPEAKPIPGLGEDAFSRTGSVTGGGKEFRNVVVYVRAGDLVVLVNGDLPANAADPAAFGARLAALAGKVLAALPGRHP